MALATSKGMQIVNYEMKHQAESQFFTDHRFDIVEYNQQSKDIYAMNSKI